MSKRKQWTWWQALYWGRELWDQTTLWNLSTIKTEQNEVHVPTASANDGEHLSALITFKFSATIIHTPGTLTSGDFHPDRSDGYVVPRWKSPAVLVDCEFGWKLPDIIVSVSSAENHPTLWLEQGFPNFHLPCTISAFRQMSMYPFSISTDECTPKISYEKIFIMISHGYI